MPTDEKEIQRCTGHCCKDFTLPLSPMEIAHEQKKIALGKPSRFQKDEFLKIADMVIFKRTDMLAPNAERGEKHPRHLERRRAGKFQRVHHYTCRHFDKATGNCMNYENRPQLCSGYPYGRKCHYRGCTRKCEECPAAKKMAEEIDKAKADIAEIKEKHQVD